MITLTAIDIILIAAGVGLCQRIYDKFDYWYFEHFVPRQVDAVQEEGGVLIQVQGKQLMFHNLDDYKAFIDNNMKSLKKLREDIDKGNV